MTNRIHKSFTIVLTVAMTVVSFVSIAPSASAATTGPSSGLTLSNIAFSGSDDTWSNPSNAVSSNDSRVTAVIGGTGDVTDYLRATGFGFSIPVGSTVDGIVVSIERSEANTQSSTIRDSIVRLVKNNVVTGSNKAATTTNWPTVDAVASYGTGTTDKWGTTWTVADINSANFGVVLSATRTSGGDEQARVDHITITVHYTPPVDVTAPDVTIDSASPNPTNSDVTVTWHANENGSFNIRTGSSNCSNGTVVLSGLYSTQPAAVASIIPAGSLAEGSNNLRVCVSDAATNNGSATTVVTKDTVSPIVGLSSLASSSVTGTFLVTATFSEPVTGFTLEDISVVNGTATNLVASGSSAYIFDVTPASEGLVTVDIASGVADDLSGNDNTAAEQFTRIYDTSATVNVVVNVVIDDGGLLTLPSQFTIQVPGANPASFPGNGTGTSVELDANTAYSVAMQNETGYFAVLSSECSDVDGILNGESANCAITIHDIPTDDNVTGNLIPNPSLENPNGSVPFFWSANFFDVTATFSYPVQGVDGADASAVRTEITADAGGEAKWSFDEINLNSTDVNGINVSEIKDFVYRSRYKSNVPTRLVVAEWAQDGPTTFTFYDGIPASPDAWAKNAIEIHVKPSSDWLKVYQVLQDVGWLEVDRNSLVEMDIVYTDFIPNYSVETVSPADVDKPMSWFHGGFGDNIRVYSYPNEGHDGVKSARVDVSNYIDGDANWAYGPQYNLTPGEDYRFTGWYKSDVGVTPHVAARFIDASGNAKFFGMQNPFPVSDPSVNWQEYSDVFTVPSNTVAVQIFFLIRENGWIQVDDVHITPYEFQPLDRPLITLTFDDGAEDNVTTALPVLEGYNFDSTHCFNTGPIIAGDVPTSSVNAFFDTGHEVCAHTVTHPQLTKLTAEQVETELVEPKAYLEGLILSGSGQDVDVTSFASPFGDYNVPVLAQIVSHYETHRTVDEGYNSKDSLNLYRLRVQNMNPATTIEEFQGWVNKAVTDKTWLIIVYHGIRTSSASLDTFDTMKSDFDAQMAWLKGVVDAGDITVKRLDHAILEVTTVNVEVSLSNLVQVYDGTQKEVTVTTNPVVPSLTTTVTYNGSPVAPTVAGSYSVVATVTNVGYVGTASGSLVINPKPVTVTADAKSKTIGDADPTLTYTVSGDGLAASDSFTGELVRDAGEAFGVYAINQGTLSLDSNYDLTYVGANLAITAPGVEVTNKPATLINVNELSLAFSSADVASVFECKLDLGSFAPCTSIFSTGVMTEGEHTFTVKATDSTLHVTEDSATFTVDTEAPTLTVDSLATADTTPTITGTTNDTASVFVNVHSDDFDGNYQAVVTGNTWSVDVADVLANGNYQVTATSTDAAGNFGSSTPTSIGIDTEIPNLSIDSIAINATIISGTTDEAVTILTVQIHSGAFDNFYEATTLSGGTWSLDLSTLSPSLPVSDAVYEITARAKVDALHNAALQTSSLTVDHTAPVIVLNGTDPLDVNLDGTYVELGAVATDAIDASVDVVVGGDTVDTSVVDSEFTITYNATDDAGNPAVVVTRVVRIKDLAGPVIALAGDVEVRVTTTDVYTELGAVGTDNVDPSVTVVISGTVDTNTPGTYEVAYNATDVAGNTATEVIRTVIVSDLEISDESNATPGISSVTINWTTNNPSTSRVVWGLSSITNASASQAFASGSADYGYTNTTVEDSALVLTHSVTVSGLSAGTTYYFRGISHGSPETISDEVQVVTATPTPTPTPAPSGGGGGGGGGGGALFPLPTPTPTPTPGQVLGATIGNPASLTEYGLQEGTMISASGSNDPDIYIVNAFGYKRLFLNPAIFNFYGHLGGWDKVKSISVEAREAFPTTTMFRNCETNDSKVYAVEVTGEDTATLHWVNMTGEQAVAEDADFFKKVFCVNNSEFSWYTLSSVVYTALSQVPVYSRSAQ